jgi:hypothetical protein
METRQDISVLDMINKDMGDFSRNEMLRVMKLAGTKCFKDLKETKLTAGEEKCVENFYYNYFENTNINKI